MNSADCDDGNPQANPAATELCNGFDDDCDGTIDVGAADAIPFYADSDADSFGAGVAVYDCNAPIGYVGSNSDCDDNDGAINPGAPEQCNGLDDDCDGVVDGPASIDALMWYPDLDGDGYGESPGVLDCFAPANHIEFEGDCDDTDPGINPDAAESCDGLDNDCDGTVDDNASCPCTAAFFGGSSYLFCTQSYNWWDARSACESYGNHNSRSFRIGVKITLSPQRH